VLLEGSGIYLSWTIEEVVAFTSLQKVSRPAKEDGQILTIRWPDGQNLTIYDGQNMTILTVGAICVTLCNPCSFFGTYNTLHEQLNPMGCLGCTLLSLILNKPMTPFQGMHYGNTLGELACLRLCCL
jgi:hypothetical protein